MMLQGFAMAKKIHVGDDKDSLFMHKDHMIQQTLSHSSKVMATNNLEILTLVSQPHFGLSVRMKLTLPKVRT
jgi:hypothetical protein